MERLLNKSGGKRYLMQHEFSKHFFLCSEIFQNKGKLTGIQQRFNATNGVKLCLQNYHLTVTRKHNSTTNETFLTFFKRFQVCHSSTLSNSLLSAARNGIQKKSACLNEQMLRPKMSQKVPVFFTKQRRRCYSSINSAIAKVPHANWTQPPQITSKFLYMEVLIFNDDAMWCSCVLAKRIAFAIQFFDLRDECVHVAKSLQANERKLTLPRNPYLSTAAPSCRLVGTFSI